MATNSAGGRLTISIAPVKSSSKFSARRGWLDYPRPKTAIDRRCKLWPETLEAVKASIAKRTSPKNEDHSELVFITKYGGSWNKDTSDNPISNEMAKLLKRLGLHRPGVAFYALRHTFEDHWRR